MLLHRSKVTGWLIALVVFCGGCSSRQKDSTGGGDKAQQNTSNNKEGLVLASSAFDDGQRIPKKHTGDGDDLSPPLTLPEPPAGAKTWAIICDDPDAPSPEPWVHWVIYNIPIDCRELPEGIARAASPDEPAGACQGTNSWSTGNIGYRGPQPPIGSGKHRYYFHLYALDAVLDLSPEQATKESLLEAMEGRILDETRLLGTYEVK